ncbi:MAG TPA: thiol:disulfide interchange protein DsbA/DsbL [Steroidobacteraceae bacterium]|nr:thiol:disulfide interchange protein DsbA/DsbL [Steroidobacteraceae bacterium]
MKPALLSLLVLATLGLAACGESPQQTQRTDSAPATSAQQSAAASQPAAAAQPAATAEQSQPAATASEQLSEAAEDLETTGERSASVSALPIQLAAASTPATSGRFEEGKNYRTLVPAQPTDAAADQVEVVEVFWYGCGHCFTLDPSIDSWKEKRKPGYVDFKRLPATWNDTLRLHARMFFTAEALGKLDELHPIIFREMHVNRNMLNTPDKIRELFVANGVSAADFDKTFGSFAVETKLQRAELLNKRYRVTSVPMIVVNGKYTTDVGSAGGVDPLFDLIGELSAPERGAG